MPTRILQTYKDIPAVAISNGKMQALFLPGHGGKMASLVWEASGREFLVQAKGISYRPLAYDGDYVDSECSGFVDMFPTIDRFCYDRFPWEGAVMPDHGEVCGLPWACVEEVDGLRLFMDGVSFPYRLEKQVHFTAAGDLRIAYKLTNRSPFDLDCL